MVVKTPQIILTSPDGKQELFSRGSYPSVQLTTDQGRVSQVVVDPFVENVSEYLWDGEKIDLRRIPFVKPLEVKVSGTPSTVSEKLKSLMKLNAKHENDASYKGASVSTNYENLRLNSLKAGELYVKTFDPKVDCCTMPPSIYSRFQDYVKDLTGIEHLAGEKNTLELISLI
jgi:hypothetical protein